MKIINLYLISPLVGGVCAVLFSLSQVNAILKFPANLIYLLICFVSGFGVVLLSNFFIDKIWRKK